MGKGHTGTSSTGYVAPTMPAHFGPAIYVSPISVLSRRPTRSPSLVEPLAKAGSQLPTLFRVQDWQFRTPTSSNRFQSPGPRDKLSSAVLNFPFAALRFIIKGLRFANANHCVSIYEPLRSHIRTLRRLRRVPTLNASIFLRAHRVPC